MEFWRKTPFMLVYVAVAGQYVSSLFSISSRALTLHSALSQSDLFAISSFGTGQSFSRRLQNCESITHPTNFFERIGYLVKLTNSRSSFGKTLRDCSQNRRRKLILGASQVRARWIRDFMAWSNDTTRLVVKNTMPEKHASSLRIIAARAFLWMSLASYRSFRKID